MSSYNIKNNTIKENIKSYGGKSIQNNNNSLKISNINIEKNLDNNIDENNDFNEGKSIQNNNNSLKISNINIDKKLDDNIEENIEINKEKSIHNNNPLKISNINIEKNFDNNIEENFEFNKEKSIHNNNSLKISNINKENALENNIKNKIEEDIKSNEDKKIENNNFLRLSNINNENNFENNYIKQSSSINENNIKFENSFIAEENRIYSIRNNFQNNSLNLSQSLNNPILIQLIEFGYDPIYSKRIIQYFHPLNIEEALDYLNFNQGVVQHRFIKDRNINNITCYICGERKEIHLGYIPENEKEDIKLSTDSVNFNIDNKKSNIFGNIEINNIEINFNQKKCAICSEFFIPNDENTVKQCGHSFCNSCWYDFFSAQIQENKLTSIKCLNYECQEKLNDEFIIHLLNNNNELIKKYQKYQLEYEILNNPNKKNCPFQIVIHF